MREVKVNIEKTLKVPDEWAMFTDEGNRIVGQRMCGLVEECNGEVTAADVYRVLDDKNDLYKEPTTEAGDTDVREVIFWFLRENNVYKENDNE
jgi:hypothetical protein